MRDMRPRERADPLPDVLLGLDEEYANILALLDRAAALQRIMAKVPELTGVDVAWVGEPEGRDQIVLQHTVNVVTDGVGGLVVPVGVGLGGRVLVERRPLWVSDYCAAPFGDRTAQALEQIASRTAAAQVVAERARHAAAVAVHEERRRLALELHDSVGATLFTLRAGIRRLGDEPRLDAEVRARLTAIEEQAMEAAAALRGALRVLSAPPEQVALGVALREHCRAFAERTGVRARMIALTELPPLPHSRIKALADAAREGLLNVEKHAGARSVVVSVFALRDGVAVTVSDDGAGLRGDRPGGGSLPGDRTASGGLGLVSMSERLGRVGGTVTLAGNEDGGATLQVWTPA